MALLAAAIAVPAVAAPQDWTPGNGEFTTGHAEPAPGTARQPPLFAGEDTPAAFQGNRLPVGGPAAQGLTFRGTALDRMRAETCLTQAIYYEAAREPDAGQRAVAQVVLNRVAHPAYPNTVCGVVFQGAERATGCQFTFTCDGAMARAPNRLFWERAARVARAALAGAIYAPIGLATHYHTTAIHPYWADSLNHVGTIGVHRFYRFGGPAGAAATFRPALYRGNEPDSATDVRSALLVAAPPPDPVAIERAYAAVNLPASMPAPADNAPAYAPAVAARGGDALYTARALPQAAGVRPEYAGSGQWIARPGS